MKPIGYQKLSDNSVSNKYFNKRRGHEVVSSRNTPQQYIAISRIHGQWSGRGK